MAAVGHDDAVACRGIRLHQLADPHRDRARVEPAVGRAGLTGFAGAGGGDLVGAQPALADRLVRQALEQRLRDDARIAAHEAAHVRMGRRGGDVNLDDARAG